MKKFFLVGFVVFAVLFSSCEETKKVVTQDDNETQEENRDDLCDWVKVSL